MSKLYQAIFLYSTFYLSLLFGLIIWFITWLILPVNTTPLSLETFCYICLSFSSLTIGYHIVKIKNIEKTNVRIINFLQPVVGFGWVFIPSLPNEAIQIIPTFGYFDANRVKFVGGPSWINNTLRANKSSLGEMFVIGNDTADVGQDFIKMYREVNKSSPHLVDTLSYDAMMVTLDLLKKGSFSSRDEFETILRGANQLKGVTSEWTLNEGLWYKNMDILKIYRDGFRKVSAKAEAN